MLRHLEPLNEFINTPPLPEPPECNSGGMAGVTEVLIGACSGENVKSIAEIGFNAGHSACTFLHHSSAMVVSFDLCSRDYVSRAKAYVDETYPGRHVLIAGDSRKTVPDYVRRNPDVRFDAILIDGGHDYETVLSDFLHCRELSHEHTIVILDDTVYEQSWAREWTVGPTRVWNEALANNEVIELGRREFSPGWGITWGRYVL